MLRAAAIFEELAQVFVASSESARLTNIDDKAFKIEPTWPCFVLHLCLGRHK